MYPVTVAICRDLTGGALNLSLAELVDTLWAHALPEDGLEHIGLHIEGDSVEAVFFVKSETPESARQAAIAIFRRTLSSARPLANWKLTVCETSGFYIKFR